jgi:hypothetical protein
MTASQTATKTPTKVGTVFVRSWGYDQTNVDFYEIVSVSKTGKTGKARQLRKTYDHQGQGSDRVQPATGADRFVEKAHCARCSNYHQGETGWDGHAFTDQYTWQSKTDRVTVTTYGDHAYRWDGQSHCQTAVGWGH